MKAMHGHPINGLDEKLRCMCRHGTAHGMALVKLGPTEES